MPSGRGAQIVAGILGLVFVVGLVFLGQRIGRDLRERIGGRQEEQSQQAEEDSSLGKIVSESDRAKREEVLAGALEEEGIASEEAKKLAETLVAEGYTAENKDKLAEVIAAEGITSEDETDELVRTLAVAGLSREEGENGDTLAAQSGEADEIPRTGPGMLLFSSLLIPAGFYLRKYNTA